MGSNGDRKGLWPAAGVLTLSVLLHLSLLLLPLPGPDLDETPTEAPILRVDLTARPPSPPATEPDPPAPEPDEPEQTIAEAVASENEAPEEPATDSTPPQLADTEPSPNPEAIRGKLLEVARKMGRESEAAEDGPGLEFGSVPELPSQPGWLHQFTGRVTPSIDRWQGNDGSRNARVVTASGQVVCIRTRAPTAAETFNPWMSVAVPMASLCGRERPQRVDREDPWIRSPAKIK
jgi:hypothetical protein